MHTEIIVAGLSLLGTFAGTLAGIVTSNKLTNHRLVQLEKKVDLHNKVIERTYVIEEKTKVINHRIDDLEEFQKNTERKQK